MTVPATLNLSEVQGDDWSITLNFIDDSGYAIDLSMSTYISNVRRGKSRKSPIVAQFDIDNSNAATGVLIMELSHTQTDAFEAKTYYYDLQGTDYYGRKTTILGGKITIQNDLSD